MRRLETLITDFVRHRGSHLLPECAEPYFEIWSDLSSTRGWHPSGFPRTISYREITAYCHLMRRPLEPHQVRIIMAMDRAYLESFNGPAPAPSAQPESPLTAAAFDAVFA